MTFQTSEKFLYQGKQLFSHDEPLASHPHAPEFLAVTSMCWRGYNGSWSIQKKKLFLIKLEAYIKHPTALRERRVINLQGEADELSFDIVWEPMAMKANLKAIFPQTVNRRLFADWFTGEIHFGLDDGIGQGMKNAYKTYQTLRFEKGILVNETIRLSEVVYPAISTEAFMASFQDVPRTRRGLYRSVN
ncbi:hypothetical protein [Polynucleobacter kasalickyi]|uniref:Uncharacterized protein n=1 Tax=Polynucleobacter kasalickyi TaxID=1938817 RepID=A0A1W1YAS9_9BURK|nr:hypothetical protein [Polynucleobacter kasalickyi]SMC32901.1 hypothetical protein SAMN06296008_102144 [Polynucleobacter kasalickyi]